MTTLTPQTFDYTLKSLSEAPTGAIFSIQTSASSSTPNIDICKLDVCRLTSNLTTLTPPSIYIHQAQNDVLYSPYHNEETIQSQPVVIIPEYKEANQIQACKTIFCCYDVNTHPNKVYASLFLYTRLKALDSDVRLLIHQMFQLTSELIQIYQLQGSDILLADDTTIFTNLLAVV